MLKFFKYDFLVTLIGIFLAGWLGFNSGNSFNFILTALLLAVLEVSLSFDNAVVNASTLQDMDDKWRHRFLTWGMVIAVFGMRIVFPLIIIMIAGHLAPWEAINTALTNPKHYAELMHSAHVGISGFGGSFLAMVALKYFLDHEKEIHWIKFIESKLASLGKIEAAEIAIILLGVWAISNFIPQTEIATLWVSSAFGLITYIFVDGIGALLESKHTETVVKSGIASFLYLELLDASFSFDGVIGALAITNNMLLIAIGLGIGAMFVRSLTLLMVEKGTLDAYKYLENGAFWAIAILALIMFINLVHEVHEAVTGMLGGGLIALSVIYSIYEKHKHKN
ncbi:MAG: hypothetical protein RLZZ293_1438 [Pseudomonadota bacterium]|jgi:hypothetical protein